MAEGPSEPKPSAGHGIPTEVPKPYTVPEGYVAPKMSELWLYVRLSLLVNVVQPRQNQQRLMPRMCVCRRTRRILTIDMGTRLH